MDSSFQFLPLLINSGYIAMYIGIFFLAKWIKGMFSSYKLDEQLTLYDNNAVSISVAGYFIGISIIYAGALNRPTLGWEMDYVSVFGFSIAGILLLNLARIINSKFILTQFSVDKEIINDQNPGTGVVEAGNYVASALIIAGAIHGENVSPLVAIVFYLIGQACLILFGLIYARLTPYSVHDEIEKDNTAAGLGFAGGLVAIGIIVMKGVSGTFLSWTHDLTVLGIEVVVGFIYLILVRWLLDKFILKDSDLLTEIAEDQNIGAGILEMTVAICFASILYFVI